MKTPSNTKPTATKHKAPPLAVVVVGVLALIALVWGGMVLYSQLNTKSTANYAEEVAKPLKDALVKAGGVKMCGNGDSGRGSDNTQPWYQAYFEVPETESRTIDIMNSVASQNGYSLKHASPTNRGPLGVDDKFIDKWYFDNTSKLSTYSDLQTGQINLAVQVNADGLESACSDGISIDASHSAVGIDVKLPTVKR